MNIYILHDGTLDDLKLGERLAKRLKYKRTSKLNANLLSTDNNVVFEGYISPRDFISWFSPKRDAVMLVGSNIPGEYHRLEVIKTYLEYTIGSEQTMDKSRLFIPTTTNLLPDDLVDCLLKTFKRSVCALIQDPTTGLFLGVSRKNDPNDFGLPGGKVDLGEDDLRAVVRELKEETGLDFKDMKPVFADFAKGNRVYYCTTFTGNWSGTIYTEEKGVVKWVTKETLLKGSFGEYNRKLFKKTGIL